MAPGGTVFLDEVGDLPLSAQAKLLRVLDERKVLRVGALEPRPIDVRFISATNRDLGAAVAAGVFRADLFFRLAGVTLVLPPLRERVREIAPLARTFAAQACEALGRSPLSISDEVLRALEAHRWPGNVRELRNVIELAALLCDTDEIRTEDLRLAAIPDAAPRADAAAASAASAPVPHGTTLRGEREALERQRIVEMLERCGGNQTAAARLLGMSRRTVCDRMDRYGLLRPRKVHRPTTCRPDAGC